MLGQFLASSPREMEESARRRAAAKLRRSLAAGVTEGSPKVSPPVPSPVATRPAPGVGTTANPAVIRPQVAAPVNSDDHSGNVDGSMRLKPGADASLGAEYQGQGPRVGAKAI